MKGGVFAHVINAFEIENVPGTRLISAGLFLHYLYSAPRAPPRWGPGGFFALFVFTLRAAPV